MTRRRGKKSTSTVSILLMIGVGLLVLVGIAILITADQEPPPPVSTMAYQDRPDDRRHGGPMELTVRPRPRERDRSDGAARDGNEQPEDSPEQEDVADAQYAIVGTITDSTTQTPVAGVRVVASRVPTLEESDSFKERDRAATEAGDGQVFNALIDEKQRLWADASGDSGPDGSFRVAIAYEGDYKLTVYPQNHLQKTVEKSFVGASRPEWSVDIALETGARISGRITDSFDNRGVEGITVNATSEADHFLKQGVTDADGHYTIGGLSLGTFSVIAEIERTAYRVTKILPFRKTSITAPDQEVRGIDFQLDKGGVVWGYVRTPENEPVQSEVVLCTSESVLTQALNSLIKQAPPLADSSSREDGYYELVGVPLDEEWRLYATSESKAPQLADPFILTSRNKEINVNITIFTGSTVYGRVVDRKGRGVGGARVLCIPSYAQLVSPLESAQAMREQSSDDEGYFTLKELPAGNYQVMAHKEGYKYAMKGTALYANGYHEVKDFRVVLEDIETGNYRVFGTVSDAAGRPVPEARVVLSGVGTQSLQGVGRDMVTENNGDFEFEGVEIGTYVLNVSKPGYGPKTVSKVLLDEPNLVYLDAAAIVRGRVLARETNQAPENGYTVSASQLSGVDDESGRNLFSMLSEIEQGDQVHSFEDPAGSYEISLAAGTWRIEGRAEPLAPARKELSLLPGDVIENVDLILSADGGTIEGYVRTTDGQSPQGAVVSLIEAGSASQALTVFAQDGAGEYSTQVAEDGAFEFNRLPEGTYFAVARHPSYPQAMSPAITLAANDTASGVEVVMGPGGTLEGYVFDGGRPVSGWIVTVIANGQPYTGSSGSNGSYQVRNIPEGTFQAFASNPSAGLSLDMFGGQGYPVTIWSGSVTYQNFGEFEGITVHVLVTRAGGGTGLPSAFENIGARVVLNPGTMLPVIGEGIDASAIPGDHYTMAGQAVSIPNVSLGAWRVDYYELERTGTYRWRGMQDFEITGEEPEVTVDLYAN
jgi:hypothetical protein